MTNLDVLLLALTLLFALPCCLLLFVFFRARRELKLEEAARNELEEIISEGEPC